MAYKNDMLKKDLMDEIAEARRASLTDEERERLDKVMAMGKRAAEIYRNTEDAEDAWTRYKLTLSKVDRDALRADKVKHDALIRLFFGTREPETREKYLTMSVNELFSIAAERDMQSLRS